MAKWMFLRPFRHVYPDMESVANNENLQAAITRQGGAASCKMNGRVWWNKP